MTGPTRRRAPRSGAHQSSVKPAGLLTAGEVGELLGGMSARWVLAEARADRIPHVRLGRMVRFRAESIAQWVRELERGPVPGDGPGGFLHG